jgi:ADP-ribose pyrophosphatase
VRRASDDDRKLGGGNFLELRVTPPDPGASHGWEYVRRLGSNGVVAVLAVTDADELILVEQPRPAVGKRVIELPAGLVGDLAADPNEDPALAAERELFEETGYRAARLDKLGVGPSSAGLSTELIDFYRARGLRRTGDGGGDESESITVHLVPLARLRSWLGEREAEGQLIEPKIYAALAMANIAF